MGAGLQMNYLPLLKRVAWMRSTFFPLRRPVYAISLGDVMVQDQEGIFFIPSLPNAL